MRNSYKVLTAVAVAGLALAGGSAFTGAGLSTTAPTSQFVGGTVSQTVTGATLSGIAYKFVGDEAGAETGPQTSVRQVILTFASPLDSPRTVNITPNGAGTGTFACDVIVSSTSTVTCTHEDPSTGYAGLTSLDVKVS